MAESIKVIQGGERVETSPLTILGTVTALEPKLDTELEYSDNNYVIGSTGAFGLASGGTNPDWLNNAIAEQVASGNLTLSEALGDLSTYIDQLETGVNQEIVRLDTEDGRLDGLVTSVKTETDTTIAAIQTTLATKVNDTEAEAIATDIMGAEFNGTGGTVASSFFLNNISTYASDIDSHTTSINSMASAITDPISGNVANADATSLLYTRVGIDETTGLIAEAGHIVDLQAEVDGVEASLASTDGVIAGYFHEWDGTEPLKLGMVYYDGDVVYQYYGGAWSEGYDLGWKRLDHNASQAVSTLDASVTADILDLQNQMDGNVTSWFYSGSPEYSVDDTTTALLSDSISTGAELVTNALVFELTYNQMYKYLGTDEFNTNLTLEDFSITTRWEPVYKLVEPELTWVTDDTANGNDIKKTNHISDIYYDNNTGYSYRYAHEDTEDNPDQGVVFSWLRITDSDITLALANAATAQSTADGKITTFYSDTAPTADGVGDLWVHSATKLVTTWSGTAWVDLTTTQGETAYGWAAGASKLITNPTTGAVTGWSFADGTNVESSFEINADNFAVSSADGSHQPFTIDATTGKSQFNGVVSFTNISGAPDLVSENTNINITTNLVTTDGWVLSTRADYQFVGDPTYAEAVGAGDFLERQLTLDINDEVYTPYLEDLSKVYRISYAFKGGQPGKLVQVKGGYLASEFADVNAANDAWNIANPQEPQRVTTYVEVDLTDEVLHTINNTYYPDYLPLRTTVATDIISGTPTLDPAKWYLVQAVLNPYGVVPTNTYGKVKDAITYETVHTINDLTLDADTVNFVVGYYSETTISRVSVEHMTSETSSVDYVDGDYVGAATTGMLVAEDFGPSGTTEIDGGRITAGTSITSPILNGGTINGNTINGSLIEGGTISGVNISGSVIKSSWIDYSSTGILTNWKYYGVVGNTQGYPEIPSAYEANFAHDSSTGELITDDEGYVRLPTVSPLSIEAVAASGTSTATVTCPLHSYSSYTVDSTIRGITTNPLVFVLAPVILCSVGVTQRSGNTGLDPRDPDETGVLLYIEYNDGFNTYTHTTHSSVTTGSGHHSSGDGTVLIGGAEFFIHTTAYFDTIGDGSFGDEWSGYAYISVSMAQGTSYSLYMPDSSSRSSFKFTTETHPNYTSDSAPTVDTIRYPAISVQQ